MSLGELRHRLDGSEEARVHLLGKILREARDRDVWLFTTPEEVVRRFDQLAPYLGRRLDFWEFILCQWRELGLIRFEDSAPQLEAKRIIDEVVLDSPREILVNKRRLSAAGFPGPDVSGSGSA